MQGFGRIHLDVGTLHWQSAELKSYISTYLKYLDM